MKFLVLATCVAVSAAQGFYGLQAHPNGAITPIDEPAVAAARADHLATKFGTGGYAAGYGAGLGYAGHGAGLGYAGYGAGLGYAGYGAGIGYAGYGAGLGYSGYTPGYGAGYSAAPLVSSAPYASGIGYSGYAPTYAAGYGYSGPLNLNTQLIAHPNGAVVPVDEPAVRAARVEHIAAHGAAYAASAPLVAAAPLVASFPYTPLNYGYSGPLNLNTQLIAHPNGAVVPVDEPAVRAARVEHIVAQGAAYAASAPFVAAAPALAAAPLLASAAHGTFGYGYSGPLNLNTQLIAHPNGAVVPVDEPAVVAARADHLATKGVYGGVYAAAGPVAYAAGYGAGYGAGYAPYAGLVAHPNGAVVPVDEPAVAAARAEHLAAHGY